MIYSLPSYGAKSFTAYPEQILIPPTYRSTIYFWPRVVPEWGMQTLSPHLAPCTRPLSHGSGSGELGPS